MFRCFDQNIWIKVISHDLRLWIDLIQNSYKKAWNIACF